MNKEKPIVNALGCGECNTLYVSGEEITRAFEYHPNQRSWLMHKRCYRNWYMRNRRKQWYERVEIDHTETVIVK